MVDMIFYRNLYHLCHSYTFQHTKDFNKLLQSMIIYNITHIIKKKGKLIDGERIKKIEDLDERVTWHGNMEKILQKQSFIC